LHGRVVVTCKYARRKRRYPHLRLPVQYRLERTSGPPEEQLHERHDASDFATKTQDKIGARG
jgi:hypothetical protein